MKKGPKLETWAKSDFFRFLEPNSFYTGGGMETTTLETGAERSTNDLSISEFARRCSRLTTQYFAEMGQYLDRRMGAALGLRRVGDSFVPCQPAQLSKRAGDASIDAGHEATVK
jgi:hypothetical protein